MRAQFVLQEINGSYSYNAINWICHHVCVLHVIMQKLRGIYDVFLAENNALKSV